MSETHRILVDVLLGLTLIACWIGCLGMVRMRDPFQALHYLSWPALGGMGSLTAAVWVETGWSQATWKTLLVLAILMAANSVGTHAAARAFRAREKGHWEPDPEDREIEFLGARPRS
ncbi:MAG TPA: monovalent cation/H(+) antiporter subunit G [Acidobacteriaceae bacterium]|nr:monovalent cation/H(+) antiporter subunit G [Acidobacteriaceae bacterium]